jgi:DNA topoisomerase VI subunit B
MIVNNATSGAVISTGLLRESNFNIKMTGKAFKALSDSLYQNKIGSIVRELSCNALDSHKEANRAEIPFEIHLPSVYEPVFYVKDFGMGMAPSMIEQVYTTYFESTKDTSNDSIGGFGLGSKSSFSYATSFNVISVYDGTKYFYSAMIGEDDVPTIALFNEEATDEVNGVTIEMNVKSEDYRRF